MSKIKYVMSNNNHFIISNNGDLITHANLASLLPNGESVVSAGFVDIDVDDNIVFNNTFGKSISVRKEHNPKDIETIKDAYNNGLIEINTNIFFQVSNSSFISNFEPEKQYNVEVFPERYNMSVSKVDGNKVKEILTPKYY